MDDEEEFLLPVTWEKNKAKTCQENISKQNKPVARHLGLTVHAQHVPQASVSAVPTNTNKTEF